MARGLRGSLPASRRVDAAGLRMGCAKYVVSKTATPPALLAVSRSVVRSGLPIQCAFPRKQPFPSSCLFHASVMREATGL